MNHPAGQPTRRHPRPRTPLATLTRVVMLEHGERKAMLPPALEQDGKPARVSVIWPSCLRPDARRGIVIEPASVRASTMHRAKERHGWGDP